MNSIFFIFYGLLFLMCLILDVEMFKKNRPLYGKKSNERSELTFE